MERVVSVVYSITEKEYCESVRRIYSHNGGIYRNLFPIGLFFLMGIGTFYLGKEQWLFSLVMILASFFMGWIFFRDYIYFPKKTYRQDTSLSEKCNLRFSDEGIFSNSEHIESKLKWSIFKTFFETEKFYFLGYDNGKYMTFPKRLFESVEQQNTFQELLKKNLRFTIELEPLKEKEYFPTPLGPPDWR